MFFGWWNSVLAEKEKKKKTACVRSAWRKISVMHFAMLVVQHWVCVIHQCFDTGSGHNPACQTPWWNKAIFLLHQTVIHSKTAVNSHPRRTLRTRTVNDINLKMTQFWKTLHTVHLRTYHLAAQVSHSHVRQVKMWWIRKVYSLTSCTQMSKLWVTVAKSSTLFTRFMVRFILFNPASHWVKRTEDPHSAAATPLIYHQHNLYT